MFEIDEESPGMRYWSQHSFYEIIIETWFMATVSSGNLSAIMGNEKSTENPPTNHEEII